MILIELENGSGGLQNGESCLKVHIMHLIVYETWDIKFEPVEMARKQATG